MLYSTEGYERVKNMRLCENGLKQVHKCTTLTTDLQGCLKLQKDGLAEEDLPGFDAEAPHLCLCHLDYLPRATSPYCRGEKRHRQCYQHLLASLSVLTQQQPQPPAPQTSSVHYSNVSPKEKKKNTYRRITKQSYNLMSCELMVL